jgi:DNA-binding MarR family transcriptional regulator
MDVTKRQITKIAREVNKFTVRMLKADGIGTAEYDFIHAVRKNPGITQAKIREILSLDKGASARRAANLEVKGYIERRPNPEDKRSQLLYATEKSDKLKSSKASLEAIYYEYLEEALDDKDKAELARLVNILYEKSKRESKAGFLHITKMAEDKRGGLHEED